MNMAKTAESLLKVLRSWIGYSRSNGKHKKIIDIYNNDDPKNLPRGYKVKYTDSYCDTTVSAAAIKAGMKSLIGKECSCEKHIEIFKKKGIWEENGKVTPKAGWIILYNWDDNTQPNDGHADHIGVVESVKKKTIVVIEGNYGGAVKRRTVPVGWGYIRGYAKPKYESAKGQESSVSNNGGATSSGSTTLSKKSKWKGVVTATKLNVRKWAGTEYDNISSYPTLACGTVVEVCDEIYDSKNKLWYYIRIDNKSYGFVSSKYIDKK